MSKTASVSKKQGRGQREREREIRKICIYRCTYGTIFRDTYKVYIVGQHGEESRRNASKQK